MAKVNSSLMVASYTSDLGTVHTNVAVKFSADAPIPENVYETRVGNCGGRNLRFKPRYLEGYFETGVYRYVVPTLSAVATVKDAVISAGATCVNLVGENWGSIPSNLLDGGTYKTTPYAAADITGAGDKETGKFTYTSDFYSDVQLGYAIELAPTALYDAQKIGLVDAEEGGLGTRPRNKLLTPRRVYIKAEVDDGTTVNRIAMISDVTELTAYFSANADTAFVFGYQGESARNLV